jgi:hypothetical protein
MWFTTQCGRLGGDYHHKTCVILGSADFSAGLLPIVLASIWRRQFGFSATGPATLKLAFCFLFL